MKVLSFLFHIVGSNTPMSDNDKNDLRKEAEEWRSKLGTIEEGQRPKNPKEILLWIDSQWYCKLALAILYIPINRWLKRSPMDDMIDDEPEEQRTFVM